MTTTKHETASDFLRRLVNFLETHGDVLEFSARQEIGEPLSLGLDGRPDFSTILHIRVEYTQHSVSQAAQPDQPHSD